MLPKKNGVWDTSTLLELDVSYAISATAMEHGGESPSSLGGQLAEWPKFTVKLPPTVVPAPAWGVLA
jgi:hypothetical protein